MIAVAKKSINARHVAMTAEEYHAHPAIGSSMLEDFRASRRLYHRAYVDRRDEPKAPTPAMQFGTLVNTRLLEPELWEELVAEPIPDVAPDGKKWLRRKGSQHEQWWEEAVAERAGKIAPSQDDILRVDKVVDAIRKNWHARRIIEGDGQAEYSVFWTDPATGLECKCRYDWFSSISIDLKTTARVTPEGFAKQCVSLGYHRKRAHYLAGLSALLDDPNPPFLLIAAESDEPFRVGCYELEDRDENGYSLGVDQRRSTMHALAECLETGDWREPWEKQVCTLQLPRYAWTESEYTF